MTFKTIWPIGLFALTIALALAAGLFTSHYEAAVKTTQASADKISDLKHQYESTLSKLPDAVVAAAPKVTIPAPAVQDNCSPFLGVNRCVPKTSMFTMTLARPNPTAHAAVPGSVDDLWSKLTQESSKADAPAKTAGALSGAYDTVRLVMQPLISLLVLAAAIYVVMSSKYAAAQEKWAFGSIGTVIGFWLK